MEDDPLAASMRSRQEQGNLRQAAGDTWETRQTVGTARERTEFFLRENPVPTILGALVVGLAMDWLSVTRRVPKKGKSK